jgi:hypothetical protein
MFITLRRLYDRYDKETIFINYSSAAVIAYVIIHAFGEKYELISVLATFHTVLRPLVTYLGRQGILVYWIGIRVPFMMIAVTVATSSGASVFQCKLKVCF